MLSSLVIRAHGIRKPSTKPKEIHKQDPVQFFASGKRQAFETFRILRFESEMTMIHPLAKRVQIRPFINHSPRIRR